MVSSKLFNECLFEDLDNPWAPCPPTAQTAMRIQWLNDSINGIRAACYPVETFTSGQTPFVSQFS